MSSTTALWSSKPDFVVTLIIIKSVARLALNSRTCETDLGLYDKDEFMYILRHLGFNALMIL